jgi:transposase-like protein
VVRQIAARQRDRASDIARHMYAALTAEVPDYAAITDERLAEDVRSVSTAGVLLWLELVRSGRVPATDDLEPVREGARRRARQGFDHYALLRAWRIGIRVMWSELIADSEAQQPLVRQVLPEFAEAAMNYSDQISLAVTDAYLEEAARVAREHEHRRSALLELILSHPEAAGTQPAEMRRPHVVAVVETPDLPLESLDRVGRELEAVAGAVFWTVRSQTLVAVIPLSRGNRARVVKRMRDVYAALGRIKSIGIGGEASSVAETRQSYVEAVESLKYGELLGAGKGPVHDFAELGSYTLMASDVSRARRFVQTVLAVLEPRRPDWLEPTLEAFLSRQGRIKEAARALNVHPNTVKYRLGVAAVNPRLGSVLRDPDASAELLMALRLNRILEAGSVRRNT